MLQDKEQVENFGFELNSNHTLKKKKKKGLHKAPFRKVGIKLTESNGQ